MRHSGAMRVSSRAAKSIKGGGDARGPRRKTGVGEGERVQARGEKRPRDYLYSSPPRNFARTIYYGYTCHLESQNFIMTSKTLSTTRKRTGSLYR